MTKKSKTTNASISSVEYLHKSGAMNLYEQGHQIKNNNKSIKEREREREGGKERAKSMFK